VLRLTWTGVGDLGVRDADAPVEVADLGDELGGQATQGARGDAAGSHRAQQLGCGVGGELAGRTGGEQLGEQRVEPVHRLGAGLDHVVAVFDQGAQRGDRLVDGDGA